MLGLKVEKRKGEETRRRLRAKNVLLAGYGIKRIGEWLIFPVKEAVDGEMVEEEFEKLPDNPHSLRDAGLGLRAFDVVGDIAIVEIPEHLRGRREEVGKRLLSLNRNIRSVYEKGGERGGSFRTRRLLHVAGEERTETVHREHGCLFALDVSTVFFSPRLATERMRIARLVREGESVLDMFCGVGPFSLVMARHAKARIVHASDINAHAISYLRKNIALNKTTTVVPYEEDARRIFGIVGRVDRCLMNHPTGSLEFLDLASRHSRFMHLYCLTGDVHALGESVTSKGLTVHATRRVAEYSAQKNIFCLDLESSDRQ